eukprot:110698-Pyramimonas_sp.AAC.1
MSASVSRTNSLKLGAFLGMDSRSLRSLDSATQLDPLKVRSFNGSKSQTRRFRPSAGACPCKGRLNAPRPEAIFSTLLAAKVGEEDCGSPAASPVLAEVDAQGPVSYTHLTLPTILLV